MIKIGFIDNYLDEWHANHYPALFESLPGEAMKVCYAWARGASPITGMTTRQWCEKYQVTECASIAEVTAKSDCILVLSPDHSALHWELSHEALASGKPVYVDKTFADSGEEAERIFAASRGSPCFSASALRFSERFRDVPREGCTGLVSLGPGRPENYLIHQLEPVMMLLGNQVEQVMYHGFRESHRWLLAWAEGKTAQINMLYKAPFEMQLFYGDTCRTVQADDDYFGHFIAAVADFFRTGIPPVEPETTVRIMTVRRCCLEAISQPGHWIPVG